MSNDITGRKRLLFSLIATGGAFTFALVLTEVILRLFFPLEYIEPPLWMPDGHIKGRLAPNQVFTTGKGHSPFLPIRRGGEKGNINIYGFRGPDHARQKAPGSIRLAFFGGSSTFDFHSAEADTWPSRVGVCLERAFNRKFETVNLAQSGFDTSISKINYLVNGRFFSPDAIIVYHTWNDMKHFRTIEYNPVKLLFAKVAEPVTFNRQIKNWISISYIARHVKRIYMHFYEVQLENSDVDTLANLSVSTPISPAAYNWFEMNFRDIVRFAQSDGVLPILVSQATLADPVNDRREMLKHIAYRYLGMSPSVANEGFDAATGIIERVSRELGAVYVDGHHQIPPTLEYLEDAVHLTPKGNEALANIICENLQKSEPFIQLLNR